MRSPQSGLDNFEARYITSSFGRFISPDLMGGDITDPQTLNRYVYVRDNPLNLIDPSGLDPQSAQNCIYSIYSGATATDCYPSSAGDDQIEQNHGQAQNAPPFVPCPTCKVVTIYRPPERSCQTSDAMCSLLLSQLLAQQQVANQGWFWRWWHQKELADNLATDRQILEQTEPFLDPFVMAKSKNGPYLAEIASLEQQNVMIDLALSGEAVGELAQTYPGAGSLQYEQNQLAGIDENQRDVNNGQIDSLVQQALANH